MAQEMDDEELEIEYGLITGEDKAAILLSSLGMKVTQLIFNHMKDNEVKRMLSAIPNVNKASIKIIRRLLEEFYSALNEDENLLFPHNKEKDFIVNALGENRAKELLGQIVNVGNYNTLESLELVDSRTLSNFLLNEHPQTIAVIISHLKPDKKVDVLKRLPDALQMEIVFRIASLDYVSPELIAQLDDVLKTELATLGSIDTQQLGGVEPIAEILNMIDKNTEKNIMTEIEEKDPDLAEEIKKLMFVFEDFIFVDDKGIQNLLKKVDQNTLIVALKTAPDNIKAKLFKNMSNRAAQILQEDLNAMGPIKLSDVEKAQAEIIQICKKLEEEGKLFISRGGEKDTLV